MKSARNAFISAGFLLLAAAAGYLYYQTRGSDNDMQTQIVPALRELKQLDAEWDANVLKSRVGLANNYDLVKAPLRQVRALRKRLLHEVALSQQREIEAAVYRLEAAFIAKEDLVEQFKSQNALLHNSLRYFPTAVTQFQSLPLARYMDAHAVRELRPQVDRLLTDILRFHLMPDAELGRRISSDIDGIGRQQGQRQEPFDEQLGLLLRHARVILLQRAVEDDLMTRIAAAPTAQAVNVLSETVDREIALQARERQTYRTYLFIYSGVLLILLGYAAWRLRNSYRVIAQVNRRLQSANDTLELRVAERTAELERQSARLAELATYDPLTGLCNRRHLMFQISEALQRAQRRGWVLVLMFIDLDGFKKINDTLGHAAGDAVLTQVAAQLTRHVRGEDAVARLGGDEFVIMLNDVTSQAGATRVAEAILGALQEISAIDGQAIQVSGSIGISSMRGQGEDVPTAEALLGRADRAMYQAKQRGKNCYCFDACGVWSDEQATLDL